MAEAQTGKTAKLKSTIQVDVHHLGPKSVPVSQLQIIARIQPCRPLSCLRLRQQVSTSRSRPVPLMLFLKDLLGTIQRDSPEGAHLSRAGKLAGQLVQLC